MSRHPTRTERGIIADANQRGYFPTVEQAERIARVALERFCRMRDELGLREQTQRQRREMRRATDGLASAYFAAATAAVMERREGDFDRILGELRPDPEPPTEL